MSFVGGGGEEVVIRVVLDVSGVQQGVTQAGAALNQFSGNVSTNFFQLNRLSNTLLQVGAGLSAMFGKMIEDAANWGQELAQLDVSATRAGQSTADQASNLQTLNDQVRGLAETLPLPISQIGQMANAVAQLGISQNSIVSATQTIAQLAATTGVSSQNITQSLGKVSEILGLLPADWEKFGSAILDASRQSVAPAQAIFDLMNRLGGALALLRASAPEAVAIATSVAASDLPARRAATAFETLAAGIDQTVRRGGPALQSLADIAGQTSDQFKKSFETDATRSLNSVLVGLGRFTQQGRDTLGFLHELGIANAQTSKSILELAVNQLTAANSADTLGGALDQSNQAFANGEDLHKAAATVFGTLKSRIQELKNTIDLAGVSITNSFGGPLLSIIGIITDVIAGIETLPGPLQGVIGALIAVGAVGLTLGGIILKFVANFGLARLALQRFLADQADQRASAQQTQVTEEQLAAQSLETSTALASVGEGAAAAEPAIVSLRDWLAQLDVELSAKVGDSAAAGSALSGLGAEASAAGTEVAGASAEVAGAGAELAGAAGEAGAAATTLGEGAAGAAAGLGELGAGAGVATDAIATGLAPETGGLSLLMLALPAVIGGVTAALGFLGAKHREHAASVADSTKLTQGFVVALQQEQSGVKGAVDQWIIAQVQAANLSGEVQRLGISWANLAAIIAGTASSADINVFQTKLSEAASHGDNDAKKLGSSIATLNKAIVEGARSFDQSRNAAAQASEADNQFSDAEQKAAQAADNKKQKVDAANQALQDEVRGTLDVVNADLELQRAELAYQQALRDQADQTNKTAEAELQLQQAEEAHERALVEITHAEEDMATARQRQLNQVTSAELDLQSAQISEQESAFKVADAQQKLNDLQSGVAQLDYLKQVQALADANERLRESETSVHDAEFNLAFLRQEGAGARDIQEAEDKLAAARNSQANATVNVADQAEKLRAIQSGGTHEIVQAELDLQSAYIDQQRAILAVSDDQIKLNTARSDAANNTLYLEAQRSLTQAHLDEATSQDDIITKTANLADVQSGAASHRELEQSTNGLTQAYVRAAEGAALLQKAQAIARGETFNSAQEAHALGQALLQFADTAPPEVAGQLRVMGDALLTAMTPPPIPHVGVQLSGGGPGGSIGIADAPQAISQQFGKIGQTEGKGLQDHQSIWSRMGEAVGGAIGHMLSFVVTEFPKIPDQILSLTDDLFTKLIPKMIGGGVHAGEELIGGILRGFFNQHPQLLEQTQNAVNHLFDHIGDDGGAIYNAGKSLVEGFWHGIESLGGWLADHLGKWIDDHVPTVIKDVLKVLSPSRVTHEIGQFVAQGLALGMDSQAAQVADSAEGLGTAAIASLRSAVESRRNELLIESAALSSSVTQFAAGVPAQAQSIVNEGDQVHLHGPISNSQFIEEAIDRLVWEKMLKAS